MTKKPGYTMKQIKAWRVRTGGTLAEFFKIHDVCPMCHGRGVRYFGKTCPRCNGYGKWSEEVGTKATRELERRTKP